MDVINRFRKTIKLYISTQCTNYICECD